MSIVAPVQLETVYQDSLYLAAGPIRTFGTTRRLIDQSFHSSPEDQIEAERWALLSIATTDDFAEGGRAFLEKRPARFQGT